MRSVGKWVTGLWTVVAIVEMISVMDFGLNSAKGNQHLFWILIPGQSRAFRFSILAVVFGGKKKFKCLENAFDIRNCIWNYHNALDQRPISSGALFSHNNLLLNWTGLDLVWKSEGFGGVWQVLDWKGLEEKWTKNITCKWSFDSLFALHNKYNNGWDLKREDRLTKGSMCVWDGVFFLYQSIHPSIHPHGRSLFHILFSLAHHLSFPSPY